MSVADVVREIKLTDVFDDIWPATAIDQIGDNSYTAFEEFNKNEVLHAECDTNAL